MSCMYLSQRSPTTCCKHVLVTDVWVDGRLGAYFAAGEAADWDDHVREISLPLLMTLVLSKECRLDIEMLLCCLRLLRQECRLACGR